MTETTDRVKRIAFVLAVLAVGTVWIGGALWLNTWWSILWPIILMLGLLALVYLRSLALWIWHG